MQDGQQNISVDRYLMRAKDIYLLVQGLVVAVVAGYAATIFVVRMNDKITMLEKDIGSIRIELARLESHVK